MRRSRRLALNAFTTLSSLPAFRSEGTPVAQPLRIGVVGVGWLGGTVGRLWVQAGHEVMFSSRHPRELAAMTRSLGPCAFAGTAHEAATFGAVLLFAVPYDVLPSLGCELWDTSPTKSFSTRATPMPTARWCGTPRPQASPRRSPVYLPGACLVRAFSAVDATSVAASARHKGHKLGVPIAPGTTPRRFASPRSWFWTPDANLSWSAGLPRWRAFNAAGRVSAPIPPRSNCPAFWV